MHIKAKRLIVLNIVLMQTVFTAFAQNLTQSPYSVIGMGESHFQGNVQLSGMGNVSQGYRRPFELNVSNPASYTSLQQTVFELGYLYSKGSLNTTNASTTIDNASFAYFNLGIPISQKYGVSLVSGLMPYTAVGYNISSLKYYAEGDYWGTTQMQGRGGLSKFFIGSSARIYKNLSLGVNANFLFGSIEKNQQLVFDSSYHKFNIAEERSYAVHSMMFETGLQYYLNFKDKYKLTLGLTYQATTNLNADYTYTNRSLGWRGATPYTLDTIEHFTGKTGVMVLPQTLKTGVAFEKKGVWLIASDISYTQWSAFRAFGVGDNLTDNFKLAIGGSIVPDAFNSKNYLNTIEYRLGAQYDNGNVKIYNQQISSFGLSAGIGLPMGKSKSKLNISAEYLSKGSTSNGLIREEMFRIIVGVTFSDQWFIRYKYD